MITKEQISKLTAAEKDKLLLEQALRIEVLEARIQELEELIKGKKRTSRNSSIPPSQDKKLNLLEKTRGRRERSIGRKGYARELHPEPDEVLESKQKQCPDCGALFGENAQQLYTEYDKIEIPPIKPQITRVRLYQGVCWSCGKNSIAPAPRGYEEGSPFGKSVESLVLYMRYNHFVGYKRLCEMFLHVMGLKISQGSIANMLRRLQSRFDPSVQQILERIRSSRLICSDETGARVKGQNAWEWVFQNDQVALHVIHPTRGSQVVRGIFGSNRPKYWISDLYSAQQGHAEKWQICLAHQIRECQYGIEGGDHSFSWRMKRLFLRAIVLAKRRNRLRESTLKTYRYQLERELDKVLNLRPMTKAGEKLKRRYLKHREHLFTFLDDRSIEPTNNASERALRTSVIFRKVTNGFRSDWGAAIFGNIRSIINTGQRQGLNPFQAIQKTLDSPTLFPSP